MQNNLFDPASWDARKTHDGLVSVVDVIAHITGKNHHYAAQVYRRLVAEERVGQCVMLPLAARVDGSIGTESAHAGRRRGGLGAKATPVATAAQMVEIIWQLPGSADFRRNCAQVCVRYLGGDPSLVDEIVANRNAQERLARENPSHPARVFGAAVEAERDLQRSPEDIRRLRLENDSLEIAVLNRARQALLDAGHELDDAQEWSFRDRISNLLNGSTAAAEQEITIHAGQFLADHLPAAEAKRWRCRFGAIAARLKREADGLESNASLPTALKNVDGNPTRVVIYRWPQEKEILEEALAELNRIRLNTRSNEQQNSRPRR